MSQLTPEYILETLRAVKLPDGDDIVQRRMVSGLVVQGSNVQFAIEIEPKQAAEFEPLREQAQKVVSALPGVTSVSVVLTAHSAGLRLARAEPKVVEKIVLPHVKRIVAIASGKGGVGKSTTSVNLAIAFAQRGLRVGLLDADIYGPSIPRMTKLKGKPQTRDDKKIIPVEQYGLAVMSMGFLIAEDAPMIWRGPMVHSAITQLFRDVHWGERDILVVDMPPGTGDAQLTMAQSVPLSGAVIVSTPQDIALIDARKGLNMFKRVDVPVLGIIENMSYFLCPQCGTRSDIFGHGGARMEAGKLDLPFLGEIPLHISIRETSDQGEPITFSQPNGSLAESYRSIAARLWEQLL